MAAVITTIDNPYDPLKEFDSWYRFDCERGYNTCCYLARMYDILCDTDEELTDEESDIFTEQAIDEIISIDPFKIYKKIQI